MFKIQTQIMQGKKYIVQKPRPRTINNILKNKLKTEKGY